MIDTTKNLLKLVGYAVFEVWIHVISLIIFTVLLALKLENVVTFSWCKVFIPLFAADALTLYFSLIVFIRTLNNSSKKDAYKRFCWVLCTLALLVSFELLLCESLNGIYYIGASSIIAPILVLWPLLLIRSCKVN